MIRLLFLVLLTLSVSACTVKPITDYRNNQNFSKYATFAFTALPEGMVESIDNARIKESVTMQLEQKGLRKVDIKDADLYVLFRIESESDIVSFGSSASVGFYRNKMGGAISTPVQYQENKYGKLVLELFDTQTQSIVWKSISQRKLQDTIKVEKRTQFINNEIIMMLAEYPPEKSETK